MQLKSRWLLSWSHKNGFKKNITIYIKEDLLISPMTPPKKHANYNSDKSYWPYSCSTYCSNTAAFSNGLLWLSWGKGDMWVSHRRKGTTNFFCKRCLSPEIERGKQLTLQIIWWVREWVQWHRRAVISCLITTNHWISSNTAWPNSKMKAWLHEPWHVVDTVVLRSK